MFNLQTRCTSLENPEKLRAHIDDFLEKVFLTDSVLLYAPSQIALAAVLHSASKCSANLDNYVTDVLFSRDHLTGIIEAVRSKLIKHFQNIYSICFLYILIFNLIYCRDKINGQEH